MFPFHAGVGRDHRWNAPNGLIEIGKIIFSNANGRAVAVGNALGAVRIPGKFRRPREMEGCAVEFAGDGIVMAADADIPIACVANREDEM